MGYQWLLNFWLSDEIDNMNVKNQAKYYLWIDIRINDGQS